jgi:predicted NAD/FAD-dependent oxidoreductase
MAVVGIGMAGAVAARTLADNGCRVRLFDKARGVGGRMARRQEAGFEFDHGAQYFSVRDPDFEDSVASWLQTGLVNTWQPAMAVAKNGVLTPKEANSSFYVGTPGMNTVIKHLVSDLSVALGAQVVSIDKICNNQQWQITTEAGIESATYDGVIIAIPPAQAAALLNGTAAALSRVVENIRLAPCWAVMLAFAKPLPLTFDGLFFEDTLLTWAAHNTSKPQRPNPECWVLHGTADWSRLHMEDDPSQATEQLLTNFFQSTGLTPVQPLFAKAHRWRFARVENPLQEGYLWDPRLNIGCCGDWCQSARVEGAFLSGKALAKHILASAKSQ